MQTAEGKYIRTPPRAADGEGASAVPRYRTQAEAGMKKVGGAVERQDACVLMSWMRS